MDSLPRSHDDYEPMYSLEAETAVLGMMIRSERVAGEMVGMLVERDFHRPAHRTIFRVVRELVEKRLPSELPMVHQSLKGEGLLLDVGGMDYLTELSLNAPTARAEAYGQIVLDKSQLRQGDEIGRRIVRIANEGGESALAQIRQEAKAIEERLLFGGQMRDAEVDPRRLVEKVLNRRRGGGSATGFYSIDSLHCRQHGGLAKGQYALFQAPTGNGKTTTMRSMVFPALDRGERVVIATFADLTGEDWTYFAHRYASRFAGTLEECYDDEERDRLRDAADRVYGWNWAIYEGGLAKGGRTIEAFRSWLMRDVDKHGAPTRVVMDYAQKIQTANRSAMEHPTSRNQHVAEATDDLAKQISDATFLVGCQVTAAQTDRGGKTTYHAKHASDWDDNSALTLLCLRGEMTLTKNRFGTDGVTIETEFDKGALVVREAVR